MNDLRPEIEIQNEGAWPVDEARLILASETTLRLFRPGQGGALTVALLADAEVASLNRRFRGIDSPTDVLSFPADAPLIELHGEPEYLGDLAIAVPYASAQAEREGHPLMDSFMLLVVHGTLHVLGYDHATPEARAIMWEAQETVLRALGISPDLVPALETGGHP